MHSPRPLLGLRSEQQRLACTHRTSSTSRHQALQLAVRGPQDVANSRRAAAVAAVAPESVDAADSSTATSTAAKQDASATVQQKRSSKRQPKNSKQQRYTGRLLLRQEHPEFAELPGSLYQLRGQLPRGVTSNSSNTNSSIQQQWHQPDQQQPQHQQTQQQQQPQPHIESLKDKNMAFSRSLKHLQGLTDWLALLQNPRWGAGLCDLDGVSVVGALVWLVKSKEWQQGFKRVDWKTREGIQSSVEALLDRASTLIMPQSNSSSPTAPAPAHSSSQPPAAAAAANLTLLRPADLVSVIYCSSKLGQHRPQLLAASADALAQDLYACSNAELIRLIWGLANARVNAGDPWLFNFCKAAQAKFFMAEPGHLALAVWSLARLGYRPPDVWIAAWLEASQPLLERFSAQNLTNAAWGLSCWRFRAPDHWLDSLYAATQTAMPQMEPVAISQLQLALVTLGASTPPPLTWIQQMVATAEPLFCKMELLQLCNFGWALAQWRFKPAVEVMQRYLGAVEPQLVGATPTDLSTMLWICDKLSFMPHQSWLDSWFASTAASLPRCQPQHLTTFALVLGNWGLVPNRQFSMDFWKCTKARFKDFTAYQSGLMLWGLGMANRSVPNTWATTLLSMFTEHLLPEAEPQDICRLIGGFSSVKVKPSGSKYWAKTTPQVQEQLLGLCKWVLPQLAELEPSWFVVLIKGIDGLGLVLDRSVLQGFTAAAAQFDERLEPKQRSFLVGLLKSLQQRAVAAERGRSSSVDGGSSANDSSSSNQDFEMTVHLSQRH